jgi:hypothetical protein
MPLTTVSPGLLDSNAQYNSFKNRLINGQMTIDQRYAGASVNLTGNNYTIDRWNTQQPAQNIATQRNAGSVTPPVGFTNYLGFTVALAATPTSSNIFQTQQIIEGFNAADLGWGTASASTVALSFWVRSSLTGTFSGSLSNDSNARSYPFTFAINAANTWEYKTVTIPGDTTGTWLTNNGAGIKVGFSLGMGSTYSGTANTWQAGTFLSATGATNLVATSGATFYITSVQLEKGSTATSFDYRPYGTELALCQRYYEVISCGNETLLGAYTTGNGSRFNISAIPFCVEKRTAPSMPVVTPTGQWVVSGVVAVSANTATNFTPLNPTTKTFGVNVNRTSGGSTPSNGSIYMWEQSVTFTAPAEL